MKILFIAAQLYLPQLYGGVQTSTDELCHALIERGHRVALLVKLMPGGWFGLAARLQLRLRRLLAGCSVARDTGFGYPVWRAWFPHEVLDYVVARERPDLIVIMSGGKVIPLALAARATGLPLLVQLHDVAFEEYGDNLQLLGAIPYIANSAFTAEKYRRRYGIAAAVINPFIRLDKYRTVAGEGDNVTFVNPVEPKGVAIALAVAALCPEIPFTFVEGWTLSPEQRAALEVQLAALPNVTLQPSRRDMRTIYRRCRILLVPSTYEETFGRVTVEAQANGIPIIGSQRGGLPEAIGEGGILADPHGPVEAWAAAIRTLWHDREQYRDLSAKALAHSQRPERDRDAQTTRWEDVFRAAVGR